MNASKEQILKLREETGAGMLDCKRALLRNDTYEDAKKYLQSTDFSFGKSITLRR